MKKNYIQLKLRTNHGLRGLKKNHGWHRLRKIKISAKPSNSTMREIRDSAKSVIVE